MRISDWSSDMCASDLWQLLEGDYLLPRNTAKAIEILTELSGRGDNLASRKLASLYFTGKNDGGGAVLRDYDKYIFYMDRAVTNGSVLADRKSTRLNSSH